MGIEEIGRLGWVGGSILSPGVEHEKVWRFNAVFDTGALNYVEFRAAMHPTWCMAERVGFEPTSPFGRTAFRERRLKPLGNLSCSYDQIKTTYPIFNPP